MTVNAKKRAFKNRSIPDIPTFSKFARLQVEARYWLLRCLEKQFPASYPQKPPIESPTHSQISAHDSGFDHKMEIARRGIKKYRTALIELAK